MNSLLDSNKTLYFIFLCLFTFALLFFKKAFIEYETAAFMVLDQKGQIGIFHLLSSLQYLSIPLIYLFKFTIITFLVWVGSFLFGYRLTYKELFGLVIIAESIFLIPEMLKIGWFMVVETDPNLFDIKAFYPLSLINLVDYREVADKYHYPLKALNLFEVAYWFILVHFIQLKARKKIGVVYGIVFLGYVLFFLIWLLFYIAVYK